jgi:sortilin (neurotensin receptor 3)
MSRLIRARTLAFAAVGIGIAVAATALLWDSSGENEPVFTGLPAADSGPIHVHGLGIDPADGSLYIATHTGLWRVAAEEKKAHRVTDRRQDTMGFTIAASDRFLGSGHPDLRESRVPRLGLIESRDQGRTWDRISLFGKADFHILRVAGPIVYGFDSGTEKLFVSRDAGETWAKHKPPQPLIDLVFEPSDPRHVVASSESRLYQSRDAGATWQRLDGQPGYLAWPATNALLRIGARGDVWRSAGPAAAWNFVGLLGGEPAALLAISKRELYAALHDGTIKQSSDGGASWRVRSTQ